MLIVPGANVALALEGSQVGYQVIFEGVIALGIGDKQGGGAGMGCDRWEVNRLLSSIVAEIMGGVNTYQCTAHGIELLA